MSDNWTTDEWCTALRQVFRQALLDPEFRNRALRDGAAAFAEATGRPPPPGTKLRFVDALQEHVLELPKVALTQVALSEIDISRILFHSIRQQSIPPPFPTDRAPPPC